MIYVDRTEALGQMETLRSGLSRENKRVAAGAVQECVDILVSLPVYDTFSYAPKEAQITEAVEPWYPGALTGRAVARCGFCQTQVDRKDKYCRFCGRKLTT